MIHRNYDNWKTAHSEPEPIMCSECGLHESIREFWVDDGEPGMVRLVEPCHLCVGKFKAVVGEGSTTPTTDLKKAV